MNFNLWIERNTFKIKKEKHSATVEFFVEVLSNPSSRGIKFAFIFLFHEKKNKIRRYYLIVGQSMNTVPLYNYF